MIHVNCESCVGLDHQKLAPRTLASPTSVFAATTAPECLENHASLRLWVQKTQEFDPEERGPNDNKNELVVAL